MLWSKELPSILWLVGLYIKDGHRVLYSNPRKAPTKVLSEAPRPFGQPAILSEAHMAVSINWGSFLWVSL